MDGIFLDYDDPLFGVIVFFIIVFVASFLTYSYNIYKEKVARSEYKELLNRFGIGNLDEADYVHLYKTYNLPFDSILLLATSFVYKGDYNKSISIYLTLLEHVQDKVKKEELLELLGTTYFKGGFLKRSVDIFLKLLEFSPRNQTALKYLLICYEKLKEYDKAFDVLESLKELNIDTKEEKIYILLLKIINDPLLTFEKKTYQVLQIYSSEPKTARVVAQYLLTYNKELFWKNVTTFNLINILDLLWYINFNDIDFDVVKSNEFLEQIYAAKGYLICDKASHIVDLDILALLYTHNKELRQKVDLGFEFVCNNCKKIHPMYESRCPHCHTILSLGTKAKLIKRIKIEENISLQ
ncbi:tetratricopeptide repeat protein [Arcobacter sp. FWKO B]|uniref:tetratricopeptide repeat protein n=1 Tax=Arcobacter sp. FWKO B TaxID=2593672 RepID=UPI0018A604AA|nr:tetratricopeptide repeat protein [Arcobacter sp. FWKO B]QOG11776.1 tetratricopeptide repeat protein [Arcobacter sp. FWKO B]